MVEASPPPNTDKLVSDISTRKEIGLTKYRGIVNRFTKECLKFVSEISYLLIFLDKLFRITKTIFVQICDISSYNKYNGLITKSYLNEVTYLNITRAPLLYRLQDTNGGLL